MENYNDNIELKDILIKFSQYKSFLFEKKIAIIVFSFLFFVIGLLYAFQSANRYNAELTFVVEGEGSPLSNLAGIAGQFGLDFSRNSGEGIFSQGNIIELLKSRGVIVSTLMKSARVNNDTKLLIEHYLEINKIKEYWDESGFKEISFYDNSTYIHDSISGVIWLDIIASNLTVDIRSEGANIITLSYISSSEEFSRAFVEQLIDEMSKMYTAHQTAQANNTLDFLQDRADSVFSELKIAEQEFARMKDINARIIKASGRLKELQLMRRVEVLNAMYLEIVKNLEISKLTLLKKTPIINIIDKPILPLPDDKPSSILISLLAGFLGAFLSSCYFILIKLFKDTLADS